MYSEFTLVQRSLESWIKDVSCDGDVLQVIKLDTGGIALLHHPSNMIYLLSDYGSGEAIERDSKQ